MKHLSDTLLLEAYFKSIELNLSLDFINIIKAELEHRNIPIININGV